MTDFSKSDLLNALVADPAFLQSIANVVDKFGGVRVGGADAAGVGAGGDGSEEVGRAVVGVVEVEQAGSEGGAVLVEHGERVEDADGVTEGSSDWSDEVNEAAARRGVSTSVVEGLVPYALESEYQGTMTSVEQGEGRVASSFMHAYVRTDAVKSFRAFVASRALCKIPKNRYAQFALCRYTTATVPTEFFDGKRRLKSYAALGDLVLSMHVAATAMSAGQNVESAQSIRSRLTNDAMLSRVCVGSGLHVHVVYPAGVDVLTTKLSATALEAVVGFLALHCSIPAAITFLRAMQL